jgi:hypothetical protein
MRDHQPVVIEQFNGLFQRGTADSTPLDHFRDGENLKFTPNSVKTRDGIDTYRAIANVVRMYNYVMQEGESLLILNSSGEIYHSIDELTTYGPILSIPEMTDFKIQSIAGRAYITPIQNVTNALGINSQRGVEDEFVYVYLGDGTAARKAAGVPPTAGSLTLADGGAGNVEAGVHIFGVAYETDTGYITKVERLTSITVSPSLREIDISNIPTSPDSYVVARRIVATRAIAPTLYTGDVEGYEIFFVPNGRIDDNTTTTLSVSFFDSELLSSASYLYDLLDEIPAGAVLNKYHDRMVVGASFDDISLLRISVVGEPEAIDAVSGLVIIPLDGNPLTEAQEYRDVLYAFKQTRTYAVIDNGDVPSSWPVTVIDQGIGCSLHGMASVLDSGGVNIDYLIISDYSGLMVFNGAFARPELSFKIENLWLELARNDFNNIQVMNDSLGLILYMTLPDKKMLIGDYANGFNPKDIKWMKWRFDIETNTIALVETNKLLIGSFQLSL